MRSPRTVILAAISLAVAASTAAAQDPRAGAAGPAESLAARNAAFLATVRDRGAAEIAAFFPRSGEVRYLHTQHEKVGDRAGAWRFPADGVRRAIENGPLRDSFQIQVERQPIGLFAHQVMIRGVGWRRVGGTRFVPPGARAASPTFVEWRREGTRWVVSAFGDETFGSAPLPPWCC